MTRKITFFLLLWIFAFPVRAALSPEQAADAIQKSYEQTRTLQMEFRQSTYVQLLEKEVHKAGSIYLKKPGKFAVLYDAASGGRQYRSDGKKLWIGQAGDKQWQSYAIGDEEVPAEALSFLSGLGQLKRDFAVEAVDPKKWEQFQRAKDAQIWLELTPRKKLSQIDWLVMAFDPKSYLAQELYLMTDNGNMTHYRFEKLLRNIELGEEKFKK